TIRKKQVLKLHGCITRPHSIVATRKDYETCIAANPLLFNKVRDLMATKTFLFTGYSLQDADFREVWGSITTTLGRFSKLAYALDPHASDEDLEYWKERGIVIFRLFDVQVFRALRRHLVEHLGRTKLDPKLRELAYIRTSEVNSCGYCLQHHKKAGRKAGLDERQVNETESAAGSALYDDLQQDVLQYAEEVTRNVVVGDELADRIKQNLTEQELVELAVAVALANFTNRISETLRLELP
ncbi:MAG: SIR2 family protein, partial [Isosphaeraceae bacterium]